MSRVITLFSLLTLLMAFPSIASAKTMSVQVEESYLRSTPSYFGTVTLSIKYADRLTIIETKGAWTKASFSGKTGWIHNSALTKKKLKLASGKGVSSTVSSDELSAAEKGFTKQIENEYRKNNKNINFAWVDKMEKIKVSPKVSATFLKQGQIKPAKGGAE